MTTFDTPAAYMADLNRALASDPSRTRGINSTFAFDVSGPTGGEWWIEAKDGKGAVHQGSTTNAEATIRLVDTVFLRMANKQLTGADAFMDGLLSVEGDQAKAMFLAQIFGE